MNRIFLFICLLIMSFELFSQNQKIDIIAHGEWPCPELYENVESIGIYVNYFNYEKLREANKLTNLKNITINSYMGNDLPIYYDFKYLEKIHIINCPNLNIDEIFSQLTCDTTLKRIKIISCNIKNIPNEIYNKYINLEELSLRDNKISYVKKDFSSVKSLQFIDLSDNNIRSINFNWHLYTKLKKLILSGNKNLINKTSKLNSFCNAISNLNIEYLYLDKMKIKGFSCSLGNLKHLYNLQLRDNKIKTIPECNGFEELGILNLIGNKVTNVPEMFKKQAQLKSIFRQ